MAETTKPNLYTKLLNITEEIGKIDKTGKNAAQGYSFIEQSKIVAEVRVQLAKHGVVIVPETVSRTIDRYTKQVPGYKPSDPPKEQATIHANVVSRYTIINVDNPEERFVCEWDGGEALDTSDKATNKAITASQKYFLMKLFNISDQDDPDSDSTEAPASRPAVGTTPSAVGSPAPRPLQPERQPAEEEISPEQIKKMHAMFTEAGYSEREQRLQYYKWATGRSVGAGSELTKREASKVIEALAQDIQQLLEDGELEAQS